MGTLLLDHDLQLLLSHDSKSPTTPPQYILNSKMLHNLLPILGTIIFSYDDSMHYTLTWSRAILTKLSIIYPSIYFFSVDNYQPFNCNHA